MNNDPDLITELSDHQIFVFGSNLAGKHHGGAALQAWQNFGALQGCGVGPQGHSYAIATLDYSMQPVSLEFISKQIRKLYRVANLNHSKEFIVTKVGCGLAGFKEEDIWPLFRFPPHNVILPMDWGRTSKESER